jgi:DNA-binding transcriptional ArsR family regulator
MKNKAKAQVMRQKIIAWLNDNQGSTVLEIATGLGVAKRTVQDHMQPLREAKSIKSTKHIVGNHVVLRHRALVPADIPELPGAEPAKPVTIVIGNRTIHNGMNRAHPLPDQRGQGAVRKTVYAASAANMI